MITHKRFGTAPAEETVGWVLDFISREIAEDISTRWKLSVDAHRYLRLWRISSKDGELFIDPPGLDLRALQKELSSAFEIFLKPLF